MKTVERRCTPESYIYMYNYLKYSGIPVKKALQCDILSGKCLRCIMVVIWKGHYKLNLNEKKSIRSFGLILMFHNFARSEKYLNLI